MTVRGRIALLLLSASTAGVLAAQTPPVRDSTTQPATGMAALSGVVTDAHTGHPLRRVNLSLSGGALRGSRNTVTDEQGRFDFSSLPFGQFGLNAQKAGYLTTFYGSTRPGRGPNQPAITLSAAAASLSVSMKLSRGAVVTGIVTDPNGQPAQNVRLSMMQYRMANGERQLTNAPAQGSVTTDDRGVYRLYGLLPGDYLIAAIPNVMDPRPITTTDVRWAEQQIQQTRSGFGRSSQTFAPAPVSPPPDAAPPVAFARVFYPGSADPSSALTLTLQAGEERTGVDFALQYVPSAKVSGTVVSPDAQPLVPYQMNIGQPGIPPGMSNFSMNRGPDTFTYSGLPPGQYRIFVRTNPPQPPPPPAPAGVSPSPAPARPAAPVLWGATDVVVSGADVTDVAITLRAGLMLSGRLSFEAISSQPPENLTSIRVLLGAVSGESGMPTTSPSTNVNADGTFTLNNIVPGRYRLNANGPMVARIGGPPASWVLKRMVLDGQDITDRIFEIKPDVPLRELAVVWGDQPAQLTGQVLDAAGAPTTGYTVVLFTTDRAFWGLQSRRTVRFPVRPDGRFNFGGLLPGEYYISAVTEIDANDFGDPSFFEELVRASLKITVAEGEKKVQDLRLAGR